LLEAIRNGSVVTWRHFNLHGSVGLMVPEKQAIVGRRSLQNPTGLSCRLFKRTPIPIVRTADFLRTVTAKPYM
jgi:hypothetical protein